MAVVISACSGGSNNSGGNPDPTPTPEPTPTPAPTPTPEPVLQDSSYYILPPGNFGGLPITENSLDQLPLYDALTPLRGNVTDADIERLFLPQDLQPIGETRLEPTGRPGVEILYDEFGVPHITGQTRADLMFGAGWVMTRDRSLLINLGRGPARVAVADVPGINAFGLVTSGQSFVPSAATEQLVSDQVDLLIEVYGEKGQQIVDDMQAYVDGANAYQAANNINNPVPYTVNDVVATTAFIGSIFGAGGGNEARNAEFLSTLVNGLGEGRAQLAWDDVMLFEDPEAATSIDTRFDYGIFTGGEVTGSAVIDAGSVVSLDPTDSVEPEAASAAAQVARFAAVDEPPSREASNFLIIDQDASENGTTMAVMGPQLGYYYPEIVMQMRMKAPGIDAQGIAVSGLGMYLLIGRTADYAWSLTSANHDVRDVFVELLCNPDGSAPTRESLHYFFEDECVPFEIFDAGLLNDVPVRYPVSVHGPMIGTATSNGRPVALTRARSTFGRDALNLAALKDMTEGLGSTPEAFWEAANQFGFTFNWGYLSRDNVAFFSSGYLPVRAAGLDRRLPTWGTGDYEWQGFLTLEEHPHAASAPDDRLLNWNNQAAPGFMHGDSTPYGSVHRVEAFDQFPDRVDLAGLVGVMNRSATEDVRSPVWPVISEVLRGGEAPSELSAAVVALMDEWVADDAPTLDVDEDGFNDSAGPTIMAALIGPLAEAVMRPIFGDLVAELNDIRSLSGNAFSGSQPGASYIDKDLRTLLERDVQGPFNLSYCGGGDLALCRESLWQVVELVALELSAELGDDPNTWLSEGRRGSFIPGLIPDTFRATNRPTFQQVLEFVPAEE
ncbi:MAG: penicillin acylase family protein [Pseudomonadota bacterium]